MDKEFDLMFCTWTWLDLAGKWKIGQEAFAICNLKFSTENGVKYKKQVLTLSQISINNLVR